MTAGTSARCSLGYDSANSAAFTKVTLPIEVMGEDGTTASVSLSVPMGVSQQVRSLWLQIHGLEYAGLASIRLNDGPWIPLDNHTADVAEPGRSYGGIGGGFATLKLTVALAAGTVRDGQNLLQFRFNHSNGVVSGFRVLALNLLTADQRPILSAGAFDRDDPATWAPPLPDREDILEGERLWRSAALKASDMSAAKSLRARCSDCHAEDGRDLKYFNYSNLSIVARSRFHGLSTHEGEQIASYIRSLSFPSPGRPWDPPYQPGPGLDLESAANWAAGAGLGAVLDSDSASLPYIFPAKDKTREPAITPAVFAPDGNLNQREIPIAMQLPDWNHWLPQVHPLDAWGEKFTGSDFSKLYTASREEKAPASFRAFFDAWLKARRRFLTPPATASQQWTPAMAQAFYSTLLWQLVKTWEITQRCNLEAGGGENRTSAHAARSWTNTIPAATAPATVNIPDSANGMAGSGLTNEYFDNAWYELQILLNSGSHQHHGRDPVDWVYIAGHAHELERWSGRPEPARLLITAIKATQWADPALGPGDLVEGWRPEQNIDPRMMVAADWAPAFAGLPADQRRALAQAWLTAWLDKSSRYPIATYFYRGQLPGSYAPPKELRDISGGRLWESAPQFRQAGVDPALVHRLEVWGAEYAAAARLFRY